ncbi:MAG: radical SAM protein [Deltaproteobacteria bacterium]|nr:radical SAM protein [Deltaproteobacteria bacterium]
MEHSDPAPRRNGHSRQVGGRRRDGRRVALVCRTPGLDFPNVQDDLPSYGVRRIHASIISDPRLQDAVVQTFDTVKPDVDDILDRILAFDPDIVGFSAYVWSLPCFLEVARRLRAESPDCTILFGGPSARPEMFGIDPYKGGVDIIDALAIQHAEETVRDVVLSDRSPDALARIAGLAVARDGTWHVTPGRSSGNLELLASPAQLGLIPRGAWHYLETYRGCPMSCSFCQWGRAQAPKDVLSMERIAAELAAFAANDAFGVVHLDAGLTLNERAFRNFSAAEREVGFLAKSRLSCEVYPAHLTAAHVEFLQSIGCSYIGVGLQSYNEEVLSKVDRVAKPESFDTIVRRLVAAVGNVAVEIILGLPGDSIESFKQTTERALALGADVHAFHCLVLPDAFLTRAPAEFALDFDPVTLKVKSCLGWTADQIQEARDWIRNLSGDMAGTIGDQEWITGRFLRSDVRPRGVPKEADARWPGPVATPLRADLAAEPVGRN